MTAMKLNLRTCHKCGKEKPESPEYFCVREHGTHTQYRECWECRSDYQREWRFKKLYGLTMGEYYNLLEKQGGCCAICGTTDPGTYNTFFTIDHCHATNKVRGLLCVKCNMGLGQLGDSVETVRKALDYLEKSNGS